MGHKGNGENVFGQTRENAKEEGERAKETRKEGRGEANHERNSELQREEKIETCAAWRRCGARDEDAEQERWETRRLRRRRRRSVRKGHVVGRMDQVRSKKMVSKGQKHMLCMLQRWHPLQQMSSAAGVEGDAPIISGVAEVAVYSAPGLGFKDILLPWTRLYQYTATGPSGTPSVVTESVVQLMAEHCDWTPVGDKSQGPDGSDDEPLWKIAMKVCRSSRQGNQWHGVNARTGGRGACDVGDGI